MKCKVCSGESLPLGKARILSKYDVGYFRCSSCGFVQTEAPYWLKESYTEAIASSDVGLIRRNLELARMLKVMLPLVTDPAGRFIDYGGGNGMLVRMMRDEGFDFRWHDAHSDNQFAEGFGAEPGSTYELLTAFEVLEHLEDPRGGLQEMLEFSDRVLISTYLLPEPCPLPGEWWYYGLDHGQHIALFSRASLEKLAAGAGARLYSNGTNLHLVARRPVSQHLFRLANWKTAQTLLAPFFRRKSLLQDDFSHSIRQSTRKAAKP
jgi:hypothetical protein